MPKIASLHKSAKSQRGGLCTTSSPLATSLHIPSVRCVFLPWVVMHCSVAFATKHVCHRRAQYLTTGNTVCECLDWEKHRYRAKVCGQERTFADIALFRFSANHTCMCVCHKTCTREFDRFKKNSKVRPSKEYSQYFKWLFHTHQSTALLIPQGRVFETVPSAPVGGHEQRPSLGSFAVMLHNPSVTTCWESFEGGHGSWKFENHCPRECKGRVGRIRWGQLQLQGPPGVENIPHLPISSPCLNSLLSCRT